MVQVESLTQVWPAASQHIYTVWAARSDLAIEADTLGRLLLTLADPYQRRHVFNTIVHALPKRSVATSRRGRRLRACVDAVSAMRRLAESAEVELVGRRLNALHSAIADYDEGPSPGIDGFPARLRELLSDRARLQAEVVDLRARLNPASPGGSDV